MDTTSHRSFRPPLWYWERSSFDDQMLERLVDANIASGQIVRPDWKWKLPKTYNGFSGEERVRGWQKVKVAIALGLIPKPEMCSICLRSPAGQMHSEDYSRPLLAKPICPRCHRILHRRFKSPEIWSGLVFRYSYDGAWFSALR